MSWYQIMLEVPLEKPDPARSLPTPVKELIERVELAWIDAKSPADVALFMGEYFGFSRQRFFLPPSAGEHCPKLLEVFNARLIEEPEPYRLLHRVAGSESAFGIWLPWVNLDSIEYPPVRCRTFRHVIDSDQDLEETAPVTTEGASFYSGSDDSSEPDVDAAISFMKSGRFAEALPILIRATRMYPDSYGYWYMAGQCYRFTDDLPNAIKFLKEAARRNPTEKEIFLALGIAFQLLDRFHNAIGSFAKALEIDPNYDLAYNSLALTQMKKGDFEFALHNYDEALKAMTRRLVKTFSNAPGRGITKYHNSRFSLWGEYAVFGAMFIASSDKSIGRLAWPTGEFAIREEKNEDFEGLFWRDQIDSEGVKTRMFLPNYFNTFEARLRDNHDYSTFLRAKGTALEALDRSTEAQQHYAEAEHFMPVSPRK